MSRLATVTPLPGPEDRLLALPEVAERLACSRGLVRRLDAKGVLPRGAAWAAGPLQGVRRVPVGHRGVVPCCLGEG